MLLESQFKSLHLCIYLHGTLYKLLVEFSRHLILGT